MGEPVLILDNSQRNSDSVNGVLFLLLVTRWGHTQVDGQLLLVRGRDGRTSRDHPNVFRGAVTQVAEERPAGF